MGPYYGIFSLLCLGALFKIPHLSFPKSCTLNKFPNSISIILILFIGLRHEVGGDWSTYVQMMDDASGFSFFEGLTLTDPGYAFFNWVTANFIENIYFLNLVCAFIFTSGLINLSRQSRNPFLLLVLSFPVLIINVGMGYVRQSVALGLFMWSIRYIREGRWLKYFMLIFLACLFHKSAFVLFTFGLLAQKQGRWVRLLCVVFLTLTIFSYVVSSGLESLEINYLETEYSSDGAWPRILMTILPASLYILARDRMGHNNLEKRFWSTLAVSGLLLPMALYFSPSSTAIDRLALYWIPLQLLVLSDYPNLFKSLEAQRITTLTLIVYAFAVLTTWLFFATHAYSWIPYQLGIG